MTETLYERLGGADAVAGGVGDDNSPSIVRQPEIIVIITADFIAIDAGPGNIQSRNLGSLLR